MSNLHPIPISALQHLLFCERQAALIHVERVWDENRETASGRVMHRRVHEEPGETHRGSRIARGLPLVSEELGLVGVADVVQFTPPAGWNDARGIAGFLRQAKQGRLAEWEVRPIEYKRGRPKANDCDRVQLCAQAMCLEEMLGIEIPAGDLFYGKTRRRKETIFDTSLRNSVCTATERMREIILAGATPPAVNDKRCERCSLIDRCLPKLTHATRRAVSRWSDRQFEQLLAE